MLQAITEVLVKNIEAFERHFDAPKINWFDLK
jgi:hypothetical protein